MIVLEHEVLTEPLSKEMMAIYQDYYARSKASEGMPPLDFRWEVFFQLQDLGMFRVYTARENGKLLGVAMYVVTEHLHHRGWMVADCDGLSVHLDARGRGIGRLLVNFAADDLKEAGVQIMAHRARAVYDDVPLFEKLPEFKLIEKVYARKLT